MGWTDEQYREFCLRAGVDPATGLLTGKIDLEAAARAKERKHLLQSAGAAKTNRKLKQRAKNRAKYALRSAKLERSDAQTLAGTQTGKDQDNVCTDKRTRVCITVRRVRPCDPDNNIGGLKSLIDCIRESGLITEDNNETIRLEARQEKVTTKAKEGTTIELIYP